MSTFRVIRRTLVTRYEDEVILESDDPMEVEWLHHREGGSGQLIIEGTHPSHDWAPPVPAGWPICTQCKAWDNGSVASHMPCGWEADRPIMEILREWERSRER